jgi:4-amino-4-deoxy-L-arabinose transferase-like glycosyltransferase
MTKPIPPIAAPDSPRDARATGRFSYSVSLLIILEAALVIRIVAADALEWYLHRNGPDGLCLFPDTDIYWQLARCIRMGLLYEIIEWGDIPYFALRTPGYPIFLAGCHWIAGENTLVVRLVQAVLGTVCVYLVYRLTERIAPVTERTPSGRLWTAPLIAAALVAVHPYLAMMSSFILSEAVFEPLMLAALFAIAVLWKGRCEPAADATNVNGTAPKLRRQIVIAMSGGAAAGAALLVRPSWALFLPVVLVIWIIDSRFDRKRMLGAVGYASLFVVALSLVMCPWWVRNAALYGRFVPTALWMGASLYDGLNPRATGASDMAFRYADPQIWPLTELDQDRELTRRSLEFAREAPGRVVELGFLKIARYWSPWPNADIVRGIGPVIVGATIELPLYALMAWGFWLLRRDIRGLTLLAGPILYFCALHAVFASSMRYRLPGEVPAIGLAAIGLLSVPRFRRRGLSNG